MLSRVLQFALATGLVLKTTSSSLLPRTGGYATFYTDDLCTHRSGSVNYNVQNPGIFQNGGPYYSDRIDDEHTLISYPPGDAGGNSPNHCLIIGTRAPSPTGCLHLDDYGFTTGDGGYYRLSTAKTCPTLSKRDTNTTTPSPLAAKRNSNYLVFYADPACEEQSGGVHYSSSNQGCFQNGGPYVRFEGDDSGWSLQQFSGVDNLQCTPSVEACHHGDSFGLETGWECYYLRDYGFNPGYGSYKMVRGGCP